MAKHRNLMLEMRGLVVEYRTEDETVQAVNDINLWIEKGKSLGLVLMFENTCFYATALISSSALYSFTSGTLL